MGSRNRGPIAPWRCSFELKRWGPSAPVVHCKLSCSARLESMAILIHFTQEQVRTLASVTPGEIRQWRKVVPCLAAKPGKSARFTFSDLVALAITGSLTRDMGARIGEIASGIDRLFVALSTARPTNLEGLIAVVGRNSADVVSATDLNSHRLTQPVFVVPCDIIVKDIRARMLPVTINDQQAPLPFAPVAVGTRA